jgi:MFS family permease
MVFLSTELKTNLDSAITATDSVTYLISAYIMWLVGGTWNVATEAEPRSFETAWDQMLTMTMDGAAYLRASFFGTLVLVKASGALVYGASDVLNVSFSEQIKDSHSSERLGVLFAIVGIGCLLGPLVADRMTDMSNPSSLQLACVVSMAIETLGSLGMAAFNPFWCICFMTGVRAAGSSVLWVDSSLLLQKFSAPEMLGRVFAVDYSLANLTEALAALLCGILEDRAHLSPKYACFVFAIIGSVVVLAWTCYHFCGYGARRHPLYSQLEANNTETTQTVSKDKPYVRRLP